MTFDGYVYSLCNGKRTLVHRNVVENAIGRLLLPNEVVHHIDKNKQNNNIENLMLFNNGGAHRSYDKNSCCKSSYIVFDGRKKLGE
jgi:hypothetical protein